MCTLHVMARRNIYLPDALAAEAKAAGLDISARTQEAVRRSLGVQSTDAWLATLTAAPSQQTTHYRALDALDEVGDEPATRHR